MTIEEQRDDFEGEAVQRLENFIESFMGDRRFCIPVEEHDDGIVEDWWSFVYTDRASRLIQRMIDRLYKLARLKFGEEAAFDMEISTHLYQEL
jgi:hypothetical protein